VTEHSAGADGSSPTTASRSLRFYESDQSLARIVAEFLAEGFASDSPGIVIATPGQRDQIVRELAARSYDVAALQESRDLVLLDGEETLSKFMVAGKPDAQKFRDEICRLIESVRRDRAHRAVRVFGQIVDVLWRQGQRDAAIRLELIWNQLARTEASAAVCGYAIGNFYKDARFEDVCARQTRTVSTGGSANRTASEASDKDRRRSTRNKRR
jgi:hypothetical protein